MSTLSPPESRWERLRALGRALAPWTDSSFRSTLAVHPTTIHPGQNVWVDIYAEHYVLHHDRAYENRVTVITRTKLETTVVPQDNVSAEQTEVGAITLTNDGSWAHREAGDGGVSE